MLNNVSVMGRFTKDPELRRTTSGTAVVSFTLAVDRDFKGQNGERETDFLNCVAWRGTAEFIANHFTKGSLASVSGRLQNRNFETTNGEKRTVTEIIAENIYFGGAKKESNEFEPADDFMPADAVDLPWG